MTPERTWTVSIDGVDTVFRGFNKTRKNSSDLIVVCEWEGEQDIYYVDDVAIAMPELGRYALFMGYDRAKFAAYMPLS